MLLVVVTLIFSASLFLAFNQQQVTQNNLNLTNELISTTSINSKMGTHLQYLMQTSNPSTEYEMLIFFDGTVNYTQGLNLLQNLGNFEIIYNYSNINGVCIKAPIGMAETIAQQNYVSAITYNEEVEIAPTQVTTNGVQAEDIYANGAIGATTLQNSPYNLNGTRVVVAVIDTGINPHTDLSASRIIFNESFVPYENYTDLNGHGTAVAGIIGATYDPSYPYVEGVAPAVQFLNLKVLDSTGTGELAWVVAAINEAVSTGNLTNPHPKADIISMSLGDSSGTPWDDMSMAVNSAWSNTNTIVVAAAGNEGPSYGTIDSPGSAAQIIAVGATGGTNFQTIASFSSRGPTDDYRDKPDIVAPGVGLYVLSNDGSGFLSGFSGTSASTPVVSGAIALLLSNSTNGMPWLKLSPDTVKAALMMTAMDLGVNPFIQGAGLLNISAAYNYLQDYYITNTTDTPPLIITPIRAIAAPMFLWDLTPADLVLTVVVGNLTSNTPIINASFTVSGNASAFTTVSSGVFSSLNDTQVYVPVSFILPLWGWSAQDFSGNLTLINGTGAALFTIPLALNDASFTDLPLALVLLYLYVNDITNLSNTANNAAYLGIGSIALGLVVAFGIAWERSKRKPISPELQQLSTMFVQYCPYCGTKVEANELFCPNCGKQIRIRPYQP
jgi:subtilisin family serine protease